MNIICESDIDVIVKTDRIILNFMIFLIMLNQIKVNMAKNLQLTDNIIWNKKFLKTNCIFISEEFIKLKFQ